MKNTLLYSLIIIFSFIFPIILRAFFKKKIKFKINNSLLNILLYVLLSNVISLLFYKFILIGLEFEFRLMNIAIYSIINTISSILILIYEGDIIKIIENKIEKLSNKKWIVITFIVLFIIMMLVSIKMLYEPWIMVEDGKIFINQQLKYGIGAIFKNYGGYCILISRLTAWISCHIGKLFNSFTLCLISMKWITILFEVFLINYLNNEIFKDLIPSRINRLLISIFTLLLFGNFQFFFYNTTSAHWYCGFLCFLIGINLLEGKIPKWYMIPIICLCILSSASSLIISFALLYYIIKKVNFKSIIKGTFKNIGTNNFIKISLIGISLLLQAIYILYFRNTEPPIENSFINTIMQTILLSVQTPIFITGTYIALLFENIYISSAIGILFLIITFLIFYNNKKTKIFIYSLLSIIFLYFMILFKNTDTNYYKYLFEEKYWLYNALPAIIYFINFIYTLSMINKDSIINNHIKKIIYILLFILLTQHLYIYSFEYVDNIKKIEEYVDFNSEYHTRVEIFPGGKWYVNVPIRKEYCEINDNVCY